MFVQVKISSDPLPIAIGRCEHVMINVPSRRDRIKVELDPTSGEVRVLHQAERGAMPECVLSILPETASC